MLVCNVCQVSRVLYDDDDKVHSVMTEKHATQFNGVKLIRPLSASADDQNYIVQSSPKCINGQILGGILV